VSVLTAQYAAARLGRLLDDPVAVAAGPEIAVGIGPRDEFIADDSARGALTPAAVLIPLLARAGGGTVLLTQRNETLAVHGGQVAFPGGAVEAEDDDVIATALREAEEEVGLPRDAVQVIGALEERRTISNYRVTPVVALVNRPFVATLQEEEVADVFEVPIDYLLDPANHELRTETPNGTSRPPFYAIPYEGRMIWGFTARVIVRLAEVWHDGQAPTRAPGDGES
jgi:8-oxo-dGTP pyrophosphatase MutT (NUDIX family)